MGWTTPFIPLHLLFLLTIVFMLIESIGRLSDARPLRYIAALIPNRIKNISSLRLHHIPRVAVLFFYCISFCVLGYFLQFAAYAIWGHFVAFIYILLPALLLAWGCTWSMIHNLDQVVRPYSIQRHDNLVGRLGTIVSGHAKPGVTAQATVRDCFGALHYVLVEAEFGELELQSRIILVAQLKYCYIAKKITPLKKIDH